MLYNTIKVLYIYSTFRVLFIKVFFLAQKCLLAIFLKSTQQRVFSVTVQKQHPFIKVQGQGAIINVFLEYSPFILFLTVSRELLIRVLLILFQITQHLLKMLESKLNPNS